MEERPLPLWGGDEPEPNDNVRQVHEPDEDGTGTHVRIYCTGRQYARLKALEASARRAGYGHIDRDTFSQGVAEIFGQPFRDELLATPYSHLHLMVEP